MLMVSKEGLITSCMKVLCGVCSEVETVRKTFASFDIRCQRRKKGFPVL